MVILILVTVVIFQMSGEQGTSPVKWRIRC